MARNTRAILQALKIERVMVVGHSMGGMLAARFATQYPAVVERLVIYNPIGLTDGRFDRPWDSTDEGYKRTLGATYQSIRNSLMRYVSHNPAAWTPEFETYAKIRYSWTLGAEWPRLAMVQALIGQVTYLDPVVHDWAHIKAPTLVFGGAEDSLAGTAKNFQDRMKFIADTIPGGKGRLHPDSRPRPRAAHGSAGQDVSAAAGVSERRSGGAVERLALPSSGSSQQHVGEPAERANGFPASIRSVRTLAGARRGRVGRRGARCRR